MIPDNKHRCHMGGSKGCGAPARFRIGEWQQCCEYHAIEWVEGTMKQEAMKTPDDLLEFFRYVATGPHEYVGPFGWGSRDSIIPIGA